MRSLTCELVWIKHFLQELRFCEIQQIIMHCDNQTTLHIHVFHERTKHIEIDRHFVRLKLCPRKFTPSLLTNDQLANIFDKILKRTSDSIYMF